MKNILFAILATASLYSAQATLNVSKVQHADSGDTVGEALSYTYLAREHFPLLDEGDVPYYKDNRNDALAIDARKVEYRNRYARASRTFDGESGISDVTITTLTEEDGESTFRLLVNGTIVRTFVNTHIGAGSDRDMATETHIWKGIELKKGDTISVESIAHTNGEIPEGAGTAWSRGRWRQLEISTATADSLDVSVHGIPECQN